MASRSSGVDGGRHHGRDSAGGARRARRLDQPVGHHVRQRLPRVGNIYEPAIAWFGPAQQVLWTQKQSSGSEAYFTSILDAQGRVSTPNREVFPAWQAVTKNPALISVGGQRFLSFSGLNPGRSGAQYFATSPDGLSWNVSNGSMSETQSAYASYGNDAVDSAGTPVWVGNAGTTTGIRWHVGTSDSNPAPAGTDQSFTCRAAAPTTLRARDAAHRCRVCGLLQQQQRHVRERHPGRPGPACIGRLAAGAAVDPGRGRPRLLV